MLRKTVLSGVALAAALLCGGACAAQDAALLIPADAAVVVRINSGRILDKMGGEEFVSHVMRAAGQEAAEAAEPVSSPEEWGIDLDRPAYVAVSNGEDVSAAVIMNLSDAALFERAAQDYVGHKPASEEHGYDQKRHNHFAEGKIIARKSPACRNRKHNVECRA